MRRRNTSTRKTAQAFVESVWGPLLTSQLDTRWARRAKSAIKQGDVVRVVVEDGRMQAEVKQSNFGRGMYQVEIPCISWWEPHLEEVARWLSRRMDWLAAMLAGEWADEFIETAAAAGLRLLPEEADVKRLLETCRCTCTDVEHPCRHVLCVLYWIIAQMDVSPLSALMYVGLPEDELLRAVHAYTREQVKHQGTLDSDAGVVGVGDLPDDARMETAYAQALGVRAAEGEAGLVNGAGLVAGAGFAQAGMVREVVASGSAWNSWTPEEAQVFSISSSPTVEEDDGSSATSQAKPIRPVLDRRKIAKWL